MRVPSREISIRGGRILAFGTDPLAEAEEGPGYGHQGQGDEAEEAAGPGDAQALVHDEGEEGKAAAEQVAGQAVGAGGRGHVGAVEAVGRVLDEADEDAEVAPCKRDNGYGRTRPRYRRACCPAEPEETNGQADAANHGRVEAVLRRDHIRWVLGYLSAVNEHVACYDGHHAEDAADENANEDEPRLFDRE